MLGPCPGWGHSSSPGGTLVLGAMGLLLPRGAAELLFPTVVRKLQEFELPYVSVTSLHNPEFQIILRKR